MSSFITKPYKKVKLTLRNFNLMKKVDVKTFINSLEKRIPSNDKFQKLGDLTALYKDKDGNFVRFNYERGPLIYALIAKYQPKNVLEFGTAGGYGTLCMAWAMHDYNIPGKIYTIDIIHPDQPVQRPVDWDKGRNPSIESLSLNELWSKIAPSMWLNHIEHFTGYSAEIMEQTRFPKMDFAFIDGAHFYDGVRHDFYSFLQISNNNFGVLFDDYIRRESFGVKRLVDEEISQNFETYLIDTDTQRHTIKMKMTTDFDYGMCWIHSKSLKKPLSQAYPSPKSIEIIKKYRRFEKRMKTRNKLNQKIPLLKNIKFRWWRK